MNNVISISDNYSKEGLFFPTYLDRDYLESDDPNMKRRVMNEIGILTKKMSQMKPHFYLNPQIDDELVYTYLRYFPEELDILNKWIRFPNTNLLPKLYTVADKLEKLTTFNRDTVRLYRGFWHSDSKSRTNQKYAQQRLGLSEIPSEGSIIKKSGSKFSYPLPKPISFTRSSHIANKFGTIVICGSLKNSPYKFIDNNDSLIAAVFINNGFFRIPKFYDHIRFLQEVIVLPDKKNTPMNFTISQTPVPLYFTPYNPENYNKKENNKDEVSGLYGSLYRVILKILGLENYDGDAYMEDKLYLNNSNLEKIYPGNESLAKIQFGNIVKYHEEINKFGNSFLNLIKNLKVGNRDYLMVAKTNSTNDIFQEKLVKRCLVLLKEFLNILDEISIRNGNLTDHEMEQFVSKLNSVSRNMGFTDISRTSQIRKEIKEKCTHGRVFELGYNLSTLSSILRTIDDFPVNKIISSVSKISIDSSKLTEKYNLLLSSIVSSSDIIAEMYVSIFNILKRTYNPTKEFMSNKLEEKNPNKLIAEGAESFDLIYNDSLSLYKEIVYRDFDVIGEEGLTNFITRALTSILNVLLRIINNIKAIIKRPFNDLQRTELHKFIDDYKASVNRILSIKYPVLTDILVPSPVGMIKPYKITSEAIVNTLDIMKMDSRVSDALVSVEEITNALMSGNTIDMRNNRVNLGDIKSFESVYKKSVSCFNPSLRNEDKRFSEVFPSDHCLKDTFSILNKGVDYEYCVSKVFSILEKLYSKYELILKLVSEENANITKNDLISLSEQTTTLAKMFDMYGITINDLQSVEHNFVLVLHEIKRKFDI